MTLADGTLEEAIEALAKRAADLRTRPRTYAEKQALAGSGYLGTIGNMLKNNPELGGALMGGGLGALAGGASTLGDDEHHSMLSRALTGGLAGAALGAGGGLAYRGVRGLTGEQPNADIARNAEVQHDLLPPDPAKQTAMNIAGGLGRFASRAVPGLPETLKHLGVPSDPTWAERELPFSSFLVPKLMAGDAALQVAKRMPGLNLGERIGFGRIRPEFSRVAANLQKGVAEAGKGLGITGDAATDIVGGKTNLGTTSGIEPPGGSRLSRFVNRLKGNYGDPGRTVHTPEKPISHADTGGTPVDYAEFTSRLPSKGKALEGLAEKPQGVTAAQIQGAKREGYRLNEKALGHAEPRGLARFGPWETHVPKFGKGGILGRAVGYGAIPAAEYLRKLFLEQQQHDADAASKLAPELAAQHK